VAIYHFSMKHISRGTGRSATAAAAYRSASCVHDERTGLTHDYTNKRGVISNDILAPSRAPEWARDGQQLWNKVEETEKRQDARLARENIVALPCELTPEQNKEWLHRFVDESYVKRGMVAQVSIHGPDRDGDKRNYHAHILLTVRPVTRNGFKEKKPRNWNDKTTLLDWRRSFAEHMNGALERHGHEERVDHRSFKERNIDREPTQHLGPAANDRERKNGNSRIGDKNRLTQEFNKDLDAMKLQSAELQKQINAAEEFPMKVKESANREHAADPEETPRIVSPREALLEELKAKQTKEREALVSELKSNPVRTSKADQIRKKMRQIQVAGNWWDRLNGKQGKLRQEAKDLNDDFQTIKEEQKCQLKALLKKHQAERSEQLGPKPTFEAKGNFNKAAGTDQTFREHPLPAETLRAIRPGPIPPEKLQHVPGVRKQETGTTDEQPPTPKTVQEHAQERMQAFRKAISARLQNQSRKERGRKR
jgi:hypothetical protein